MKNDSVNTLSRFVSMGLKKYHISEYISSTETALKELFWPTRCAVCDTLGSLVCETCLLKLSYLDFWKQCLNCGGPYGIIQCSECNSYSLQALGIKKLPYEICLSFVFFDQYSSPIVLAYKDSNEKRLASTMAFLMARIVPPSWLSEQPPPLLAYVPASTSALKKRGFDHGELLASELASILGLSLTDIFKRPHSKDQRRLGKKQRLQNMHHSFEVKIRSNIPYSIIVVDDVYTTGATLISACASLQNAGVCRIRCLTFARTP